MAAAVLPGVNTPVEKNILKGLSHVMIGVLVLVGFDPVGDRTDPQYLKVYIICCLQMNYMFNKPYDVVLGAAQLIKCVKHVKACKGA